ncbi:hypothetical protein LMG7974_01950 [Campylobacter majalis]|uniref:SMI1/KNR4 family protein n=1 Tax=Campylobacter majalis TaxID=2790656 RepID=A0ABN7KCQ7_9BACT|nr:hypothetical protein [Campylobacter majalis]CAD7289864.1 hypothetical protein LMG7974_01950 [Campylobacter majalis]
MKELYKIYLKNNISTPNKTLHFCGNDILPKPYALSIIQYDNDEGFYLFYLDEIGNEQTDTYHETLDDVFVQAEFEFGIKREDWIKLE